MTNIRQLTKHVDIEEIWKNIRHTDDVYNPYKFIHCEERNIIFIGRSRTGKSTVARVMRNIFHRSERNELYSETKNIQIHQLTTHTRDRQRYCFNIIDMPGFFDVSIDPKNSLTNNQIKEFVKNCITQNICNIHLFAYVFSLYGGINEQDIAAMIYTKTNFTDLSANMVLIITHCEHYSEQECKNLSDNFFEHPTVKNYHLKDFFKQGIYFMGCLRKESYDQGNVQSIHKEYGNVLDMRTKWIQKCIESETPFNIHRQNTKCCLL